MYIDHSIKQYFFRSARSETHRAPNGATDILLASDSINISLLWREDGRIQSTFRRHLNPADSAEVRFADSSA